MMKELLSLRVPLGSDILTTVRLATGGVCSLAGLGLDESEDCKVCVTESLLLLLHGGCKTARIEFVRDEKLKVLLRGEGDGASEESVEEEISVALLSALVDDLEMQKEENVTRISFGFGTL